MIIPAGDVFDEVFAFAAETLADGRIGGVLVGDRLLGLLVKDGHGGYDLVCGYDVYFSVYLYLMSL
jgi:hypothetical protein